MKVLVGLILLLSFRVCLAFESDLISERPGQALSPNCLNRGNIQIQAGVDLNSYSYNLNSTLSNTIIRFGMGEKFEINTGYNYQINSEILQSPILGFKMTVLKKQKHQIAIQYNTVINQLNKEPYSNSFKLISAHKLSSKAELTCNAGVDYTPVFDTMSGHYVVSFSINPTNKIGLVFENYGTFNTSFNTYFDLGIGFLITPLLQIDTYFGGGLKDKVEEAFISCGFTYRFEFKNNND